ncbi:hypothetical protein LTR15_009860 [Elasticomyces elasticus]|nr:hypothetical protein LTR15_009860 [Elasticomyces elasticus]
MAGKKRPKSAPSQTAKASESPTAPRASPSTKKPRRISKGRVEFIEIDSDEERAQQQPRRRGPLRDLDVNALIQPKPTTKTATDDNGDVAADPQSTRSAHTTRSTINGRASAVYDQRYHPSYDDNLRPLVAARYNSDLRSDYKSVKHETDGETSEESEPTLGSDSDSSEDDQSGGDDNNQSFSRTRVPDPKASRHSKRTEAQKPRNYSRKFHPNDLDLPGFKAKAKAALKSGEFIASKRPKKRKSGKEEAEDVPADNATDEGSTSGNEEENDGKGSDDDKGDEEEGDAEQPVTGRKADARPRKKLKSTSSGSPSAVKARKKPQPRKEQSKQAVELGSEADMSSTELGDYMEKIGRGSQKYPVDMTNDHTTETDHADDAEDVESAQSHRASDAAATLVQSISSPVRHSTQRIPTKSQDTRVASEVGSLTELIESDGVAAAPTPGSSLRYHVSQSASDEAALFQPTQVRLADLHVVRPDNAPSLLNGTENGDSPAAATRNKVLASHKSRSPTRSDPLHDENAQASRKEASYISPHERDDDPSSTGEVNHQSQFEDQFGITEIADRYPQFDGPADDIEAAEMVAKSIPDSDGSSSSSSCIVPRISQENQEEDSDNDESRNAPLSSAITVTQAKKASAVKTHGIVNMTPVTQPGNKHLTSSRTMSEETVKQNAKTSSTARAGSAGTSSPAKDMQESYEMMWQASGKPGISYNSD